MSKGFPLKEAYLCQGSKEKAGNNGRARFDGQTNAPVAKVLPRTCETTVTFPIDQRFSSENGICLARAVRPGRECFGLPGDLRPRSFRRVQQTQTTDASAGSSASSVNIGLNGEVPKSASAIAVKSRAPDGCPRYRARLSREIPVWTIGGTI